MPEIILAEFPKRFISGAGRLATTPVIVISSIPTPILSFVPPTENFNLTCVPEYEDKSNSS